MRRAAGPPQRIARERSPAKECEGTIDRSPPCRSDFPAFAAGAGHFLDSAASSLKPQVVIDAMAEFTGTTYANVHRGAYRLSMESTERYEAARVRLGRIPQHPPRTGGADSGHHYRSQHGGRRDGEAPILGRAIASFSPTWSITPIWSHGRC